MELTATDPIEDEAHLRECLGQSTGAGVAEIERHRLDSSTSYDTSVVNATLEDGRKLKLFLKDFGYTIRPKDGAQARRDREMRFYRDLAADGELGVPRYYGSVWDEGSGRNWLLLEFVEGTPVRYCHFQPDWIEAAAWLGRMHGHFWQQRQRILNCDFLERQDPVFFRDRADAAIRAVTDFSVDLGARLEAALIRFDQAIEAMLRPPLTLLHGGYHMLNVLTHIPGQPGRLAVFDWEEAGFGSPLSDLSYLINGFEPARLDQLLAAYCAAARPSQMPLPHRNEMINIMKCFRLHKRVASLPKYAAWDEPWKTLPKLVSQTEDNAREAAE